jgi:hypothetical protein
MIDYSKPIGCTLCGKVGPLSWRVAEVKGHAYDAFVCQECANKAADDYDATLPESMRHMGQKMANSVNRVREELAVEIFNRANGL